MVIRERANPVAFCGSGRLRRRGRQAGPTGLPAAFAAQDQKRDLPMHRPTFVHICEWGFTGTHETGNVGT